MAVRLRERAASSLGCVYTCGRLSLDTASHTVLAAGEPVSLAMALDKLGAEYQILSDTTARVYSPLSVTTLVHALDTETCELLHVTEQDESLESFYMNLVGGVHHG